MYAISGYCCISYEPCKNEPNAFSLSSRPFSLNDNACFEDFIIIEASSNSCQKTQNIFTHRYCERVLNAVKGQTRSAPICGKYIVETFVDFIQLLDVYLQYTGSAISFGPV